HQPVEHLASLRAIPGLEVVRPADANETAAAWQHILANPDGPKALALTRQNVPTFDRSEGTGFAPASETAKGGYILVDTPDEKMPDAILIATGSAVTLAVAARAQPGDGGRAAR